MTRPNAVLLSAVAMLSAAPLAAQDNSAVPGFDGGIHWGATKEQVNTFWREEPSAESREGTISMIAYKPWQQMNWTVYVDDTRGLIGLYAVSLPDLDAGTCERVFDGLVRAMRASFRGVEPTGEKREASGEDFCPAVRAGRAQGSYTWVEPGTGVRARVWVQPATGQVGYMMGTPYFQDWSVRRQAQQTQPAQQAPAQAAAAQPAQQQPAAAARNLGVTERAFRAIRPGMSYADVVAIIGKEGRQAAAVAGGSTSSSTFMWEEGPITSIGVTFMDNRAILTMQMGLRPETQQPPVTLAQFQRLQEGMTYEQAVEIMGGPGMYNGFTDIMGNVSESWIWRGRTPGSTASASFNRGRITLTMQMGLN
ncbi:MAG TPA: hypothetical protein VHG08_15220 [Longimicrobium sp.]|nr:hypothetical protein [Longimicrobium sp.]